MKKPLLQFITRNYTRIIIAVGSLAFVMAQVATADAQTVKRDAAGNYTAAPRKAKAERDSITGLTYTDAHGVQWPVYIGSKGSHYVGRISKKSGKYYRQYLKSEE